MFPGQVHPRLPWRRALTLTASFFAIRHVPNLSSGMSTGYVGFQVAYAAVGLAIVGLSRQWTGSIVHAWSTHAAVNAIAWAT